MRLQALIQEAGYDSGFLLLVKIAAGSRSNNATDFRTGQEAGPGAGDAARRTPSATDYAKPKGNFSYTL